MEKLKKMIVISDCMECPEVGKCRAWKKLTPGQRFTLKVGVVVDKFILKDCPLEDFNMPNNSTFDCIYCAKEWDTDKKDTCKCGAYIGKH